MSLQKLQGHLAATGYLVAELFAFLGVPATPLSLCNHFRNRRVHVLLDLLRLQELERLALVGGGAGLSMLMSMLC